MAKTLRWKEKVARSIIVLSIIVFTFCTAYSQSLPFQHTTLTISCKSMRLEKVIEDLAKASGLNIIYSSNKINLESLVSLVVINKTVEEVCALLEKKTNLSFKLKDDHIIIKSIPIAMVNSMAKEFKKLTVAPITLTNLIPDSLFIASERRIHQPIPFKEQNYLAADKYVKNHLSEIHVIFDTTLLKTIPSKYVRKINLNNKNRGLFISGGALINGYAAGFELQAGLRHLYAVATPSWLRNKTFHGAYGLGTSISLSRNFSINPIYTYSEFNQKEILTIESRRGKTFNPVVKSSTTHHQLKLMTQFALYKNIRIQAGPTFNQSTTHYSFANKKILVMRDVTLLHDPAHKGSFITTNDTTPHKPSSTIRQSLQDVKSTKYWVGWEVSISYKLNFLSRP